MTVFDYFRAPGSKRSAVLFIAVGCPLIAGSVLAGLDWLVPCLPFALALVLRYLDVLDYKARKGAGK